MEKGIILVVGVSGVGKTTLCQSLASAECGINHLIASRFVGSSQAGNQKALATHIHAAAQFGEGASLVDGHVIVDGNKVPLEAVAELRPRAIVVVTGRPRDILLRLKMDKARKRPAVTENEIDRSQDAEISWAKELARAISIPFVIVDSLDTQGFRSKIFHLFETGSPQGDKGSLNRYSARPDT